MIQTIGPLLLIMMDGSAGRYHSAVIEPAPVVRWSYSAAVEMQTGLRISYQSSFNE